MGDGRPREKIDIWEEILQLASPSCRELLKKALEERDEARRETERFRELVRNALLNTASQLNKRKPLQAVTDYDRGVFDALVCLARNMGVEVEPK